MKKYVLATKPPILYKPNNKNLFISQEKTGRMRTRNINLKSNYVNAYLTN